MRPNYKKIEKLRQQREVESIKKGAGNAPVFIDDGTARDMKKKMKTKLKVTKIKNTTTKSQFWNYFKGYGEVISVFLPRNKNRKARGFGFITYADMDSISRVLAVEQHVLCGKQVDVVQYL